MTDFDIAAAEILLVALIVAALTASALTAYTVGHLRGARQGWEPFAGLAVLSIGVPAVLLTLATHLPPGVFDFLRNARLTGQ